MIGETRAPKRSALALGVLVVLLPVLRMLRLVLLSSHLQYADYWPMTTSWLRPSGWPNIRGLFEFRNEHPVAVAKTVYWLNYRITGGSNITLGLFVVAIVVLQLILLALSLRSANSLSLGHKCAAVAVSSALLFAPFGAWNFILAMSGTAWLTANLFAILAIYLRVSKGQYWALPAAGLASLSYGTGLAVWPALVVTGFAAERRVTREWPTILLGTGTVAWYLNVYLGRPDTGSTKPGLLTIAKNACQIIGSIVSPTNPTLASSIGGVVALGMAAGIGLALLRRNAPAAPWVGLGTFGLGSTVLIGIGRSGDGAFANFTQSRYSSPAAMVWIPALVLAMLLLPRRPLTMAPSVLVAIVVILTGSTVVDQLQAAKPSQDLLAIAMHLGLADNSGELVPFPPITDNLRAAHHYPFDGRWHADCGLLGKRLDPNSIYEPKHGGIGTFTQTLKPPFMAHARLLRGTVSEGADLSCLLVVNGRDEVIGVGARGITSIGDGLTSFTALAPDGARSYHVLARLSDRSGYQRLGER